jgi:hypothetical protein
MACSAKQGDPNTAQSVYEFTVTDIKGNDVCLDKYRGHPLIIVNVACKCGYTDGHYRELNELYADYADTKGTDWVTKKLLQILIHSSDKSSIYGSLLAHFGPPTKINYSIIFLPLFLDDMTILFPSFVN